MRGRPGRGAGIGLAVSLVLLAVLFLPRIIKGDYYEIGDPLAFFAAPFLVLGTGVGALIGVKPRPRSERAASTPASRTRQTVIVIAGGAASALAAWTMLWAMGFINVSPLGIG